MYREKSKLINWIAEEKSKNLCELSVDVTFKFINCTMGTTLVSRTERDAIQSNSTPI